MPHFSKSSESSFESSSESLASPILISAVRTATTTTTKHVLEERKKTNVSDIDGSSKAQIYRLVKLTLEE